MDMSSEEMKERNSKVNYEWGHDPPWQHSTYRHDMSDVSGINFLLVDESTSKYPKSLVIKRNPQLKPPQLSPALIWELQQQRVHPLKRMGGITFGYNSPDLLTTYTKGNLSYYWQKPRDPHELIETQNVSPMNFITFLMLFATRSRIVHAILAILVLPVLASKVPASTALSPRTFVYKPATNLEISLLFVLLKMKNYSLFFLMVIV